MSQQHLAGLSGILRGYLGQAITNQRPPIDRRMFVSPAIDNLIDQISAKMVDQDLATIFQNCYPNTLDTTVTHFVPKGEDGLPDTFVITGDIQAMWLRDSTNQVIVYMPYAKQDPNLQTMLLGVVYRQAKSILIDSYANAFNLDNTTQSPWMSDRRIPPMTLPLHEGKYELDSLCAFLKLSYSYWNETQDPSPFQNLIWQTAVQKAVNTIQIQQKDSWEDKNPEYFFQRETSAPTDTLMHGVGIPSKRTGMSKSPFRPSDDAATLPFPIAANSMAVVSLKRISQIFSNNGPAPNPGLFQQIISLANEIEDGIRKFGIINHVNFGQIYAFEVDGFGNTYVMDDANIPSLLSLPYLGWCEKDDPLYLNTRKVLLSPDNPYWCKGSAGSGIGGPHIGLGWIWPMSIITQAETSTNDDEILGCLELLKNSTAGTGFMHESFWKEDVDNFTRSWFAWANSHFGNLILTLAKERPHLIFG
eukprot:TRINITY_DN335_c0_g2_i5.p1 TRINITY_DN335_c0_g2~~TRINITY_DN335_c0_g2_i5.p1  ORF type:complete len:474 (-),score=85.65 TRINITY_DN335_c0_g2_i5:187-1608(-)